MTKRQWIWDSADGWIFAPKGAAAQPTRGYQSLPEAEKQWWQIFFPLPHFRARVVSTRDFAEYMAQSKVAKRLWREVFLRVKAAEEQYREQTRKRQIASQETT